MWGELDNGQRKYEAARNALASNVETQIENREVALRVYGHRTISDCRDSELVVPFASSDLAKDILAAVNRIRPKGQTPIDYSLRQALIA